MSDLNKAHHKIDSAIESLISLQTLCDEVVLELDNLKKRVKKDPNWRPVPHLPSTES